MKVLYISYDGLTDALGQSQILAYLKRIASENIQIDILSYEKPEVYESLKPTVLEQIKDKNMNWHPLDYTKKPPVVSTMRDIKKGWRKAKELYAIHKYDIVHCRGYISAIIGKRLKKKYGIKFIFDMRGWWPDEKKESGVWASPIYKPVYNYFKKLEVSFFKQSDITVSLTHVGKEEIVKNNWKKAEKVGVIPTCVDFDIFKAHNEDISNTIKAELNIPQKSKVLLYSGSLGGNYDINDFLSTFEAFQEVYPDSYFLILSKTDPNLVQPYLEKTNINQEKVIIRAVPFTEVHRYLMVADVGIILYKLSFSVIGRSPTKMGEYWACGLPAIGLKGIGDLDYIAQKYTKSIFLAESMSKKDLVNTFTKLNLDTESFDKFSLRENSKDYFSIEKGKEFYKNIYLDLTK